MILYTSLQWLRQTIHQSFNPQNTPHSSPYSRWAIWCLLWEFWGQNDSVITAPHCTTWSNGWTSVHTKQQSLWCRYILKWPKMFISKSNLNVIQTEIWQSRTKHYSKVPIALEFRSKIWTTFSKKPFTISVDQCNHIALLYCIAIISCIEWYRQMLFNDF